MRGWRRLGAKSELGVFVGDRFKFDEQASAKCYASILRYCSLNALIGEARVSNIWKRVVDSRFEVYVGHNGSSGAVVLNLELVTCGFTKLPTIRR